MVLETLFVRVTPTHATFGWLGVLKIHSDRSTYAIAVELSSMMLATKLLYELLLTIPSFDRRVSWAIIGLVVGTLTGHCHFSVIVLATVWHVKCLSFASATP